MDSTEQKVIPTDEDIQHLLLAILEDSDVQEIFTELEEVKRVETFERASLLTRDKGVVLRLNGGAEFQITVVQSKEGRE